MSTEAKDYFVAVGDNQCRIGRVTASTPGGLEDTEAAVRYHQKCNDEILKISNPVDNEPTFGSPRYNIHLHIDIENMKIVIDIVDGKTGKELTYEKEIAF